MKSFIITLVTISFIHIKFKAQEDIKITNEQTKAAFNLIFGNGQANDLSVTEQDKNKAIYYMQELVKGSCEMSYIQSLSAFSGTLNSLVKTIANSIEGCENAKNGKYYESVRKAIAVKNRSEFLSRKATGEW